MKKLLVVALVLMTTSASLHATELPHNFTAGTPAKAAEVNANFAHLENLVNSLSSQLASQAVPPGTVVAFAGTTAPAGWLMCDGSEVGRANYSALYAVIGNTHGRGDNVNTFHLPDYRGRFLRGVDGTAGRDPNKTDAERPAMNAGGNTGNNVGSVQGDQLSSHNHSFAFKRISFNFASGGYNWPSDLSGDGGYNASTGDQVGNNGGNETRPINAYVNYIIKY